jgi:mycothiol synthase
MIKTVQEQEKQAPQNLLQPQLVMLLPDFQGLPEFDLPAGYTIRCYRPGDEEAWRNIISQSFDMPMDSDAFDKQIKSKPAFLPERVLFVVHQGVPVATATAWSMSKFDSETGYLHMVGVLPEERGKRLGFWVSLAVMYRFVAEKKINAVLETDDFRISAIKTYLQLNFQPLLVHENQRKRWTEIFKTLKNGNVLLSQFGTLLSGTIHQFK